MGYTPTNWQTGDTVTAEKLNKAENGIKDNSNMHTIPLIHIKETGSNKPISSHSVGYIFYALYDSTSLYSGSPVMQHEGDDLVNYGDTNNYLMYPEYPVIDVDTDMGGGGRKLGLFIALDSENLAEISGNVVYHSDSYDHSQKNYQILGDFEYTLNYE